MHPPLYLKESAISFLKQEAKSQQRKNGRRRVQILNQIAAEQGFRDWKDLLTLREITQVEESKIVSSLIVMVEIDAEISINEALFTEMPDVPILCARQLIPWVRNSIRKIGLPGDNELLFDLLDQRYRYWRYIGDEAKLPPKNEIERWFQRFSPVGASLFMFKGELLEPQLLRLPL